MCSDTPRKINKSMRVSVSSKYLQPAISADSEHLLDGEMGMHYYDEHHDNLDYRKHAPNDMHGSAQNSDHSSTNDKRNDPVGNRCSQYPRA